MGHEEFIRNSPNMGFSLIQAIQKLDVRQEKYPTSHQKTDKK